MMTNALFAVAVDFFSCLENPTMFIEMDKLVKRNQSRSFCVRSCEYANYFYSLQKPIVAKHEKKSPKYCQVSNEIKMHTS